MHIILIGTRSIETRNYFINGIAFKIWYFSNYNSQRGEKACTTNKIHVLSLSHVRLFANPWTVSLPGSSLHGILQARILEWVAMPSSRGSFQPRNGTKSPALQVDSLPSEPPGKHSEIHILMQFSLYFVVNKIVEIYACVCAQLCIPCTVGCQAPLSREFARQNYWSGLPFPTGGDLPEPGIKLESPALASRLSTVALGKAVEIYSPN